MKTHYRQLQWSPLLQLFQLPLLPITSGILDSATQPKISMLLMIQWVPLRTNRISSKWTSLFKNEQTSHIIYNSVSCCLFINSSITKGNDENFMQRGLVISSLYPGESLYTGSLSMEPVEQWDNYQTFHGMRFLVTDRKEWANQLFQIRFVIFGLLCWSRQRRHWRRFVNFRVWGLQKPWKFLYHERGLWWRQWFWPSLILFHTVTTNFWTSKYFPHSPCYTYLGKANL